MNAVELVIKLNALESPNVIRDLMVAEGVTGYRGDSRECVIARYLGTHSKWPVTVGYHRISVWDDRGWTHFPNSSTLTAFLLDFDHGRYPEIPIPSETPLAEAILKGVGAWGEQEKATAKELVGAGV